MDLSGIYPALTTPFAHDGSVSVVDIKYNIQRYNSVGFAGYVAIGSTGESVLLSRAEAESVLVAVREAAAPGMKLIAGTGAEGTAETIERTKRAAALGYDVALVKTPNYYKPMYRPDVFIAHYRRVADASPIPVMLYSVPIFTGISLESTEIAALSQHPNIIGIKESSGVIVRLEEMLAAAKPSFQILVGAAATVFSSMMLGARGGILALASALPDMCVELYNRVRGGQLEKARELQFTMCHASKTIIAESSIAGIKFVMDQRGYRGGIPRQPLLPLSDAGKHKILDLLASLEPVAARA